MKSMRVLIVRIGAMGDVLHAMPAVAALRQRHPEWFIGWAIEPKWSDLLQIVGDPNDLSQIEGRFDRRALVDRWYSVPAGAWKQRPLAPGTLKEIFALRSVLRGEQFDLCVDMQGSVKSVVVGRMAGAAVLAGPAEPRERVARRLYKRRIELDASHVVEQGCELLGAAVGETLLPARVTLPVNEMDERWADGVVAHERFCLSSPGAGWGAKGWPTERFGRVAAELGRAGIRTVVNATLHGSREADHVVETSNGFARLVPCSVGQLIALTRRAASGDRGRHRATAPGGGPGAASSGHLRTHRSGAQWAVRNPAAGVAGCEQPDQPQAAERAEPGMLRIGVEEVVAAAMEMLG